MASPQAAGTVPVLGHQADRTQIFSQSRDQQYCTPTLALPPPPAAAHHNPAAVSPCLTGRPNLGHIATHNSSTIAHTAHSMPSNSSTPHTQPTCTLSPPKPPAGPAPATAVDSIKMFMSTHPLKAAGHQQACSATQAASRLNANPGKAFEACKPYVQRPKRLLQHCGEGPMVPRPLCLCSAGQLWPAHTMALCSWMGRCTYRQQGQQQRALMTVVAVLRLLLLLPAFMGDFR